MNTVITSREAILQACCAVVTCDGPDALNIRSVAKRCGISVGALYHYFPSKAALLAAAVEEIWREIFREDEGAAAQDSFCAAVADIFEKVRKGASRYPNFFTAHALVFASPEKGEARPVMQAYVAQMKAGLLQVLARDKRVRPDAFDAQFAPDAFVDFVFASLLSSLMRRESDCALLLELIRRAID